MNDELQEPKVTWTTQILSTQQDSSLDGHLPLHDYHNF